jgi:hypothetical protein
LSRENIKDGVDYALIGRRIIRRFPFARHEATPLFPISSTLFLPCTDRGARIVATRI